MSKKYIFDNEVGKYNLKSKRYQTKRDQEKKEFYEKCKKEYLKIQLILKNSDFYTEEEITVYTKRFNTLKKYFSINRRRDDEIKIPFQIDNKTTVLIRLSKCYNPKWIKLFGEEYITNRIKSYTNGNN